MDSNETKCEVCMVGHATKRVRSILSPELYVYYCMYCAEHQAEPIRIVNMYLSHTPSWAIPTNFLDTIMTWDGYDYRYLYEIIKGENDG